PPPSPAGAPIAVLGAETFYADLLAQIGGSRVTASGILNDPSADPNEYEANPATAKLVADSSLVIVNGIGYDNFMEKLLSASTKPDRVVINVQDILAVKDDVNVHVWYEPSTMPKIADAAAAALAKLEPQNAAYFSEQKAKYLAALKPVNDKIATLKAKYAGAPIAFTENVAGYLTDAIGLNVVTPPAFMEAIESGTDPAPADVATERDLLTGHKVKALVYNAQVTSPLTEQIRELAVSSNVPVVPVAETIPSSFDPDLPFRGRDLVRLGIDGHRWGIGLPDATARARVDRVLVSVDAEGYADAPIGRLSGGEQQRLRIAQALVGDPQVLLCDEPLANLDLRYQQTITALIAAWRERTGGTVLFVTHDVNPVLGLVDQVLFVVSGRWAAGTPDDVLTSERMSELY